jgi:hypothetical protein
MRVINLFGGPNIGKTTCAARIFDAMVCADLKVEVITDYAKYNVLIDRKDTLKHQLHIFAKQELVLDRLRKKTDFVILDSPILLPLIYNKKRLIQRPFEELALTLFNSYENLNFMLPRINGFNKPCLYTKEESLQIDTKITQFLENNNIPFTAVKKQPAKKIVDAIFKVILNS